jgi:hypothetical protein
MARRQANHQTLLPQFISTMAIAILRLPLSLSSINSSCISELKTEEKQLQERLIALEEQRFMVQEMSADANKRRKFDEVAALAGNVEDLSGEIDEVRKMISGLDFEGLYRELGADFRSESPYQLLTVSFGVVTDQATLLDRGVQISLNLFQTSPLLLQGYKLRTSSIRKST